MIDNFQDPIPANTLPIPEIIPDHDSEYIATDDAQELLKALYSADFPLSDWALKELKSENDLRYGNAYAWMTRALAGWVNGSSNELFGESKMDWSDEQDDWVPIETRDASRLNYTGSSGADLIIDLIKQVMDAQNRGDTTSDIPVSKHPSHLRQSGCKDVEVYFAQAVAGYFEQKSLETVDINGKEFWHKTHGAHTYVNLEEVRYNGVTLPPGCVFRHDDENEGYIFLRVTGFAFPQHEAVELFGSAISNWHEMKGGPEEINNAFRRFARDRDRISDRAEL